MESTLGMNISRLKRIILKRNKREKNFMSMKKSISINRVFSVWKLLLIKYTETYLTL